MMHQILFTVLLIIAAVICYGWRKKVVSLGGRGTVMIFLSIVFGFAAIINLIYIINNSDDIASEVSREVAPKPKEQDKHFTKYEYEGHTYLLYSTSFMHDPNCVCRKHFLPRIIEEDKEEKEK